MNLLYTWRDSTAVIDTFAFICESKEALKKLFFKLDLLLFQNT